MINKMALDFKEVDIENFLFASLPIRFQDTESVDFEHFISHLFTMNGYTLIPTSYSADFGAHIIVLKEGVKTAVQIRRYHEAHKVGVADLRKIIGAQQYYNCQQAMVVTTSSYQAPAREMARQHEVVLWSWHRLSKAIADTFLEGMDYNEYFEHYATSVESTKYKVTFSLLKIGFEGREGEEEQPGTVVHAQITNDTSESIRVHCDLPVYITRARKQYAALGWTEDSFNSGEIHPGSTVELGFYFAGRQLSKYHKKDRIILSMHMMPQGEKVMLQQKLQQLKKTCFLVTYCYGTQSDSYVQMIRLRDEVLNQTGLGRAFIAIYYRIGEDLTPWLSARPALRRIIKPPIAFIVKLSTRFISKSEQ